MSGFVFYDFPVVVLREIFQQLGMTEIFNISICSQRSQRNVQLLMSKGKSLEVNLNASEDSMISVQRGDESFHVKLATLPDFIEMPQAVYSVNLNGTSVPVVIVGQTLYLTDRKSALKDLTRHVLKVFRCQLQEVSLGDSCSSHIPTWVIDLVNSQQDPIEALCVDAKNPSVKEVSHLFTKVKVSDHLMCSLEYASKGPRPAIKMGKMNMKRFDNLNSSWMTIEHLLNLNFEIGNFEDSNFKSNDMNIFLKHWMSGRCDRLGEVYIEMRGSMNHNEVFRGIDHEVLSSDDVIEYKRKNSSDIREICGGIQIRRRTDGRVARLLDDVRSECFSFFVFE